MVTSIKLKADIRTDKVQEPTKVEGAETAGGQGAVDPSLIDQSHHNMQLSSFQNAS